MLFSWILNRKHFNFGFISNENETCFSYSVNKDFIMVPRLTIDYQDALLGFRYSAVYSYVLCISSDPSLSVGLGCLKPKLPGCRNPHDAFKGNYGSMSTNGFKFDSNLTLFDCKSECMNNCCCVPMLLHMTMALAVRFGAKEQGLEEIIQIVHERYKY